MCIYFARQDFAQGMVFVGMLCVPILTLCIAIALIEATIPLHERQDMVQLQITLIEEWHLKWWYYTSWIFYFFSYITAYSISATLPDFAWEMTLLIPALGIAIAVSEVCSYKYLNKVSFVSNIQTILLLCLTLSCFVRFSGWCLWVAGVFNIGALIHNLVLEKLLHAKILNFVQDQAS